MQNIHLSINELKKCPVCGANIPLISKVCSFCGTDLPEIDPNISKKQIIGLLSGDYNEFLNIKYPSKFSYIVRLLPYIFLISDIVLLIFAAFDLTDTNIFFVIFTAFAAIYLLIVSGDFQTTVFNTNSNKIISDFSANTDLFKIYFKEDFKEIKQIIEKFNSKKKEFYKEKSKQNKFALTFSIIFTIIIIAVNYILTDTSGLVSINIAGQKEYPIKTNYITNSAQNIEVNYFPKKIIIKKNKDSTNKKYNIEIKFSITVGNQKKINKLYVLINDEFKLSSKKIKLQNYKRFDVIFFNGFSSALTKDFLKSLKSDMEIVIKDNPL